MITRFHVEKFKSLADFDLGPDGRDLPQFICLIGLNGSGKSTVLQAMDFAAHIVTGKTEEWLRQRRWKPADIVTKLGGKKRFVHFDIHFRDSTGIEISWYAIYSHELNQCIEERVLHNGQVILEVDRGLNKKNWRYRFVMQPGGVLTQDDWKDLDFHASGSVLATLMLDHAHPALKFVSTNLRQLKSLELLSPDLLRRRYQAADDIGAGGEKLSAFLSGLPSGAKSAMLEDLQNFYPRLGAFKVKALRAGWKELQIEETYGERRPVSALHMNDGMLRILAILAQARTPHSFLLFDEIENGINPELVEKLVNFLIGCGKQVLVTTHSPMILNYIPDDIARKGVYLLYKTERGETRSVRFFDLPGMAEKLRVLGPGEVFADTRLGELATQIQRNHHGTAPAAPHT